MRTRVCRILKDWDAQAVENRVGPGMPDIALIGSWIECKKTKEWPKKEGTKVTLDHELLPTQKVWLKRHARRGGIAYVLVQIANDFLLFPGQWAANNLGNWPKHVLVNNAALVCSGWADLTKRLPEFFEK